MCVGNSVWLGWSGTRVAGWTCFSLQQQHSRKLLVMDILMSETCWSHMKWNKIASDIKLAFYSSTIVECILYFIWLCDIIVCQISASLNLDRLWLVGAIEIRDQDTEVNSRSLLNYSFFARKVQLGWSTVSGGITLRYKSITPQK